MRIKKIYIENFGVLSKYSQEFSSDITEILAENGFGKTTLANFIKAMFYGFTNSKKSFTENDRLRYAPWQGGNFGGYLDFEHEGKNYRIERFFNPVGSTKDTFRLYDLDTNKLSKDYSKNIGEEIFKVDVEGYIRSSYIPQTSVDWSEDKKLSQNLTNMLEASESEDITKAITRLEAESKKYVKTGGRGLIGETKQKILDLEHELETADLSKTSTKTLKNRLDNIIASLTTTTAELTQIKEKIKLANKQSQKDAIYNHYKSLLQNKETIKNELDILNKFFKDKYPTKEQISHGYELLEKLSILQIELNKITSGDYIEEEFKRHKEYFKVESEESVTEEEIKEKFKENDELKKISIEREQIAKQIDETDDELQNNTVLTQTHKMIYILLGFFSTILIVPGIIFTFDNIARFVWLKLIMGILMLLLGLLFGVVTIIIFIVRTQRNNTKLRKFKKLEEECASKKAYLVETYKELDSKFALLSDKIKSFASKYESIDVSLISRFKEDDDYLIQLNNIYNRYKTYKKLEFEYLRRQSRKTSISEEYNKIKQELDMFTKYYLPNSDAFQALKQIQFNFDRYESLYIRFNKSNIELDEFLKNNEVENNHVEHIYNLHELEKEETNLDNRISALTKDKLTLENEIRNNELMIDNIFDLQSQINNEKELLEEYNKKYYVITKTIEYLKIAEEKLSGNYLNTMQEHFNKYVSKLLLNDNQYELSTELEITTEENGSRKELGFLSTGYQDVIYFCARLALLDTLFKDIKPTLVLDDPFTNLDEEKLHLATRLLKDISNNYQIIYLTCHSSRNVK